MPVKPDIYSFVGVRLFRNLCLLMMGVLIVGCASDPSLVSNLNNNDSQLDQNDSDDDDKGDDKGDDKDDGNDDDPVDPGDFEQIDSFTQPPPESEIDNPLVDILFVVDTSGSLDDEQAAVRDGLQNLLDNLPAEVDYRVAVVLAHLPVAGSHGEWSGRLYQAGSEPAVLSADNIDKFAAKMNGAGGESQSASDGGEAGLYSLMNLISSPRIAADPQNLEDAKVAGFFRENALLNVVFVSDENAICSRYLEGIEFVPDNDGGADNETSIYHNWCTDGTGTPENPSAPLFTHSDVLVELQQLQSGSPLVVSGVVHTGENPVPAISENELGYGYLELIAEANNEPELFVDLADPLPDDNPFAPDPARIAAGLGFIGEYTTSAIDNLIQRFFLTQPTPDPDSIRVTVDDVEVSFTYEADSNSIYLELEDAGNNNSQIKIFYNFE